MTFDRRKAIIMAHVARGPVSHERLAGPRKNVVNRRRRQGTRLAVDHLLKEGAIKRVVIDRFHYYVLPDWKLSAEGRAQSIINQCVPAEGGCQLWSGYVCEKRGPIGRIGTEAPMSARRILWEATRGRKLEYQQTIRMKCANPDDCCALEHMKVGHRSDATRGRKLTPAHKHKIAVAHRKRSELTIEKVRVMRSKALLGESHARLAAENGIDKRTAAQIIHGERWREHCGLFTGLMP